MCEREIGRILEGIDSLNKRYDRQELRLSAVEKKLGEVAVAFAEQPGKCLNKFEDKFVTIERVRPLERMFKTITTAAISIVCGAIAVIAVVFAYVKGIL